MPAIRTSLNGLWISMKTIVNGHQVTVGQALRDHAVSHLEEHVGKYFADATDAHVTFSREGQGIRAHVSVHVGHDIHAEGHADGQDVYTSFNLATEHVAKQLRRSKRKLRQHH